MLISPSILRLTWVVIEKTSMIDLLNLSDTMLIKRLLQQVAAQSALNGEEVCTLYSYLGSRLLLIREMAERRQGQAESDLEFIAC
jgi:hypothetical protein